MLRDTDRPRFSQVEDVRDARWVGGANRDRGYGDAVTVACDLA